MHETDQLKLQQYLNRPLTDLEEELALYAPAERGPAEIWANNIAGPLRRVICEEWRWCEKRQDNRYDDRLNLAIAVLAILTERLPQMPLNAEPVLITAIAVKMGLDQLCTCP
jgi:hypothetical protein